MQLKSSHGSQSGPWRYATRASRVGAEDGESLASKQFLYCEVPTKGFLDLELGARCDGVDFNGSEVVQDEFGERTADPFVRPLECAEYLLSRNQRCHAGKQFRACALAAKQNQVEVGDAICESFSE